MNRTPAILIKDFPDCDEAVHEAANRWFADPATIEQVSTGASFTYRFVADGQLRYLRLMPPGWRSLAEVQGELAFIDHLARGVPLARPVATSNGDRIALVDTSIGRCFALVFEAITGDAEDDLHWSPQQARAAGNLMAQMHDAAEGFVLPPDAERISWRQEFDGLRGELPRTETELWQVIDETARLFESLPASDDHYGMVHFDLSGDNLVWNGLSPTAVDFDDCMWHWYVGDIARTLVYFRETDGGVGPRETQFLAGYEEVRPLDPYWREVLPEFLRFALICELAWMTYSSRNEGYGTTFGADQEAELRRTIANYRAS